MPFLWDRGPVLGMENRPEPGCGKPATLSALAALCGPVRRLESSLEERPAWGGEKPVWALLRPVLGGDKPRASARVGRAFFPDVCPGQAERLAVLPGTKDGAMPRAPYWNYFGKLRETEKGDNLWQNQENEIKL